MEGILTHEVYKEQVPPGNHLSSVPFCLNSSRTNAINFYRACFSGLKEKGGRFTRAVGLPSLFRSGHRREFLSAVGSRLAASTEWDQNSLLRAWGPGSEQVSRPPVTG